MTNEATMMTGLRTRIAVTGEAIGLSVRSLLDHRLGPTMPIFVVLLLVALPGIVLRLLRPGLSLRRDPQVVPFVYPLF